jgi:hypothetical protein
LRLTKSVCCNTLTIEGKELGLLAVISILAGRMSAVTIPIGNRTRELDRCQHFCIAQSILLADICRFNQWIGGCELDY